MAWLSGWSTRRSVTLSRAAGDVTDYQMKPLVGESSGASGADVHCSGLCKSDFSDLRFTKADGTTLLDYWIESVSGASPNQLAVVWIKFDSIGTGDTTFFMYYGKSDASAVSNGEDTFIFFDDFSGAFPGTKWSGDTAMGSVSDGILTFTNPGGGEGRVYSAAFGGDIAFRSRTKLGASNYACLGFALANISQFIIVNYDSAKPNQSNFQRTAGSISNDPLGFGSYQIYDICRYGTDTIRGFLNGVQLGSDCTTSVPGDDFPVMVRPYNAGTVKVDWALVRKYLAEEPAWGSWGSEESNDLNVAVGAAALTVSALMISVNIFLSSNWLTISSPTAAKPRFSALGNAPEASVSAAKPRVTATALGD